MRHPGTKHVGHCATCGKHRYASRRDAKNAARFLHPEDSMRAYPCSDGYWHYGHHPAWRARGDANAPEAADA